MNPLDIITNKLTEIGIPKDAVSNLDFNSILSLISQPDALKDNIISQLTTKIGLDSSMVSGALSNINFQDLLSNQDLLNTVKDAVSNGLESEVASKAGGVIGFIKGLFGMN